MNREVVEKTDIFFSELKDDSLFDFVKKYEAFECVDRLAFNLKLQKLYKEYLREIVMYLHNIDKFDTIKLENIHRLKRIIEYLKEDKKEILISYKKEKIKMSDREHHISKPKKTVKKETISKKDRKLKKQLGIEEKRKSKQKKEKKLKKNYPSVFKEKEEKIIPKEIIEFFEIEKNDSLLEFKINYQNFNYENRFELNKILKKLYREYLNKNIIEVHLNDGEEFKEQSKEIIKKVKKIIRYLKREKRQLLNNNHQIILKYVSKKGKDKPKKIYIDNKTLISFEDDLSNYPLNKAINIFKNALKYKKIDKNIIEQAKYLVYKCILEDIDEEIINNIFSVNDCIKQRISKTSKEDKMTRKKLKDISILFDYVNYKYKKVEETKLDSLFYVVEYFLHNEDYFEYLKRLIDEIPYLVNLKYTSDIKQEHILNYILDLFLENYKKMLFDKSSDYINKDYLKNIYMLFLRNKNLSMSKKELKQLDLKLMRFVKEVNASIDSSKRKNTVKIDIKDMYTDKMYLDLDYELMRDYDEYNLDSQMNAIVSKQKNMLRNRVNLTNEYTVMFDSNYHAYSILNRHNKKILKIHVIDLYGIIVNYSDLNDYLYNLDLKQEKDSFIMNCLSMQKGITYPTITYELEFSNEDDYRSIKNFEIYASKIKINKKYKKLDNHLNFYFDIAHNSDIIDMDKKFETILNDEVIKYFKKNNLPFVYSGLTKKDEVEIQNILFDINHLLYKIDRKDFNIIYNTINNISGNMHYSVKPFDGIYSLSIINPISYIGLTLQRIIHEIVINDKFSEKDKLKKVEKYKSELEDLVAKINYYNNYVDRDVLKENKGRLVKRRKMYF